MKVEQQDEINIKLSTINAAREIGITYGNNQPKVLYNINTIRSWW